MRRISVFVTMAVILSAMLLPAHEEFRFVGTITKVQKSTFSMTTNEGEKISALQINEKTDIIRDGKKAAASDLKSGQSVVVDAYGDDYDGALVLTMRIVPKIVKPAATPANPPATPTKKP